MPLDGLLQGLAALALALPKRRPGDAGGGLLRGTWMASRSSKLLQPYLRRQAEKLSEGDAIAADQ